MENCEGLVEFLKLAQTGSFSRAARELGVSVANVSRQISALEARLGTKLFVRTTRRVTPTVAGELLALECKPLLEALYRVQDGVRLASESVEGTIQLSGGHFVEQKIVPLLAGFCRRYPKIQINIDVSNHMADLLDGHLDLAVYPAPLEDSTILVARPLQEVRMVMLASPALVRQLEADFGETLTPPRIPANRCLALSRRPWRFRLHEQTHVIEPAGPFASNSAQALIQAAATGIGLIHVPEYYAAAACQGNQLVAPLLGGWSTEDSVVVNIVYARNRLMPSRVRLLIEYLLDACADETAVSTIDA